MDEIVIGMQRNYEKSLLKSRSYSGAALRSLFLVDKTQVNLKYEADQAIGNPTWGCLEPF